MNIYKYNYSTIKDRFYCCSYNKRSLRIIIWNIAAHSSNSMPDVIQYVSIFEWHHEQIGQNLFSSPVSAK